MTIPSPRPPPPPTPPTKLAIVMSAVVFPGVGQFIQKRWVAAVFYTVIFTATLGYFVFELFQIFVSYFSQISFDAPPMAAPDYKDFLVSVGLTLLVYVASLLDTYAAHTRTVRAFYSSNRANK